MNAFTEMARKHEQLVQRPFFNPDELAQVEAGRQILRETVADVRSLTPNTEHDLFMTVTRLVGEAGPCTLFGYYRELQQVIQQGARE